MSNLSPFAPAGNSFIVNTNATPSTTQQTPLLLTGSANANIASAVPTQIRLLNKGTSDIWVNLSTAPGSTAVVPTAGTTTMGTPQPGFFVEPGVDLVFTIACGFTLINGVPGLYLNTISAVASQPLWCQLGEGA